MFVTDFVQLVRHVESTDLSTTRVSSFSVPFALQLQLNLFLLFPSPSTSISSFPHPLKKTPYSRFSYILFSPALPCPSFPFSLFIHFLPRALSLPEKGKLSLRRRRTFVNQTVCPSQELVRSSASAISVIYCLDRTSRTFFRPFLLPSKYQTAVDAFLSGLIRTRRSKGERARERSNENFPWGGEKMKATRLNRFS